MSNIEYSSKNPLSYLAAYVKKSPNRIAITDYLDNNTRQLTFGQLENRVQSLADYFVQAGVIVEDRIAIVAHNRYEIVETFLAAIRIGAIPLSINPKFSVENMAYVFNDAAPACAVIEIISSNHILPIAKQYTKYAILSLDQKSEEAVFYKDLINEKFNNGPPIYNGIPKGIVYTSGSTGFSKGVLRKLSKVERKFPIKKAGIDICATQEEFEATPMVIHVPMFHMMGSGFIWENLVDGCPMIIMRYFDPRTYLNLVSKNKLKTSSILPNMLAMCLKEKELMSSLEFTLKLIVVVGGPCSPDIISQAESSFGCRVLSLYGMTEGAPKITMEGVNLDELPRGSCGKAAKDAELKLVNASGEECDFGELWFKNETLFDGYYNRSDLMVSRFDKDGWFKSGDVFYRDEKGFFFHRGRVDDMFVCDGENIYPQEIENILSKHKDVLQSCVIPIKDDGHGHIPLAMVLCKNNYTTNEKELRKHYLRHGPVYAYPRLIKIVDEIPCLGPGKVDRAKVIEMLSQDYSLHLNSSLKADCYTNHQDKDIDETVINLWKTILKSGDINMDSSIFDFGINSIQITLFSEKIKEKFQIPLTIETILDLEVVEDIVAHIKERLVSSTV